MEKTVNLNPGEDVSSTEQKQNSICAQENPTIVSFAADMKDNILQAPDLKVDNKYLMQLERPRWRSKTRAVNKLRLNMRIILNPKLKKEKITVIQDSSSDENKESKENLKPQQDQIQ